ncbi:MAG: sialidase family protein [Gaiellaceae bacterium]
MRKAITTLAAVAALVLSASASAAGWTTSVPLTNVVATSPTTGGGYPVPAGSTVPLAGTCRAGDFNANHSESWIAVKPGTEDLIGNSKIFFDKYSTFYMFYLGTVPIHNGTPGPTTQVQGYDCVSTGTQDMPPSWTDNTDPNIGFDLEGRAYQTTLPFMAFWDGTKLHPDGAIDVSYSDDMGAHWLKGNGGQDLEPAGNPSAKQLGHVEDKQWIAVNDVGVSPYRDHVYAMWSVFNNNTTKIRIAVSRDRGQTFSKAVTVTAPSQTGPSNTYIYPSVDAAGDLYIAFGAFPLNPNKTPPTLYVSRSVDDGVTFSPFVAAATPTPLPGPGDVMPNTTFRDGIIENFAASPTHPGHLYLTYEDWVGTNMDVKFVQSTDGGFTWSVPVTVNDATNSDTTDQFQPSVAAGPNGAVAIAFYDRRQACPNTADVRAAGDVGKTNWCIDTTLQAYKDSGAGAVPVGPNVRMTKYTWDPMNPIQHVDGIHQMACAGHSNPCTADAFIGDYFGLAVSNANIYGYFVSTHYSSNVTADEGGPVYYQQQLLATVPRSAYGAGY